MLSSRDLFFFLLGEGQMVWEEWGGIFERTWMELGITLLGLESWHYDVEMCVPFVNFPNLRNLRVSFVEPQY